MIDNLNILPALDRQDPDLGRMEVELRDRTKSLYKKIETTYWELGQALYEVWDGVPGGYRSLHKGEGVQAARRALYEKWGYTSFEEYCEREVGIARRSASSLRHAYWWFEHELSLPAEVKDRLKCIGKSKMYVMAGFVTNDNVISWLEKAEDLTVEELIKQIRIAKAVAKKKDNADSSEADEHFEYSNEGSMKNPDDPREAPAPEVMHTVTAGLFEGQFNTWNSALERAQGITNSPKIGHNLEMICLDYLSTNDFKKPEDDLKVYLAKVEKLLGLKIIAIDPRSGDPKYGSDLLWAMVNHRVEVTVNPQPNESGPESGPDKSGRKVGVELSVVDLDPPPAF